jgi:hypothetical protein
VGEGEGESGGSVGESKDVVRNNNNCPALKVPRQCPLVLLVEIHLREGNSLGSEKGKVLGSGFCCEEGREYDQGLYCV